MIDEFIDALTDSIKERFGVLDQASIDDLLLEVRKDAEAEFKNRFAARYLLVDSATEQLESRIFFAEEKHADQAALEGFYGKSCRVAAVLLEK